MSKTIWQLLQDSTSKPLALYMSGDTNTNLRSKRTSLLKVHGWLHNWFLHARGLALSILLGIGHSQDASWLWFSCAFNIETEKGGSLAAGSNRLAGPQNAEGRYLKIHPYRLGDVRFIPACRRSGHFAGVWLQCRDSERARFFAERFSIMQVQGFMRCVLLSKRPLNNTQEQKTGAAGNEHPIAHCSLRSKE